MLSLLGSERTAVPPGEIETAHLGPVADLELAEYPVYVGLYRLLRDVELRGNLLVASSLCDEPNDLQLALGYLTALAGATVTEVSPAAGAVNATVAATWL